MSTPDPGIPGLTDEERAKLRRAFELLPKVARHGETALVRHKLILPEWVMQIIDNPYERYEVYTDEGEWRTVFTGRVTDSLRWIMVVFVGNAETGRFLTAYHNRSLEGKYGGRPWGNQ